MRKSSLFLLLVVLLFLEVQTQVSSAILLFFLSSSGFIPKMAIILYTHLLTEIRENRLQVLLSLFLPAPEH